jgi:3-hydroxyacyl-CoA dehydrogenase
MYHADQVGVEKVYEALCRLAEAHGEEFRPAPLLEKLARDGKGFGDI